MKKISFFAAAALMAAMTFTSCSNEDNAIPAEPIPDEPAAAVEVENAQQLVEAIAAAQDGDEIQLADNAEIVIANPFAFTKSISLVGNAEAPAKIIMKKGISTTFAVSIANAEIDATELDENMLSIGGEAPEKFQTIDAITFDNVKITGLKKAMFYSGVKNYLIEEFTVNNSIIEVDADVTVFDFTKGSAAGVFSVTGSTIYKKGDATTKSFYSSQSGQKVTEANSEGIEYTQSFVFESSTIVNFAKGKNFFTHRQNGQKWLSYAAKKCIFVDCGKKGQVIQGMNGGSNSDNPTYAFEYNAFNFEGADTSADEAKAEKSFATVIEFADAENGDFSQSLIIGDPRWIK